MSNENRDIMKKRIAPGIWEDMDGNVHFSLPELLAFFELEDTPENRRIATENIRETIRKQNPDCTIVERDKPDDHATN